MYYVYKGKAGIGNYRIASKRALLDAKRFISKQGMFTHFYVYKGERDKPTAIYENVLRNMKIVTRRTK